MERKVLSGIPRSQGLRRPFLSLCPALDNATTPRISPHPGLAGWLESMLTLKQVPNSEIPGADQPPDPPADLTSGAEAGSLVSGGFRKRALRK